MADRHRPLVLDELEQLRAGTRGEWSGRAVGGLARILTRRHSDRWDGLVLDRLILDEQPGDGRDADGRTIDDGRGELVAWVLDWLRVVAAERQTTTWGGGFTAADQRPRTVEVRVTAGWVERATLEHVERLVDLALAWTERVRDARREQDPLMLRMLETMGRASEPAPRAGSRTLRQTGDDAWLA